MFQLGSVSENFPMRLRSTDPWMEDRQSFYMYDEFRREIPENRTRSCYTCYSYDVRQERENVLLRPRRQRDNRNSHREERLKRKSFVCSAVENTTTDCQQIRSTNIFLKTEVTESACCQLKSRIKTDRGESEFHGSKDENLADLKISIDDDKGVIVEMFGLHYPIDVDWSTTPEARASNSRPSYDSAAIVMPSPHSCDIRSSTIRHKTTTAEKMNRDESHLKTYQRYRRLPRGCRLWEFIRDLLHDPQYNPSVIKWTDKPRGEFRLVKSHDIARMWGEKKNNEGMTYEKLSRAMRYYYKRQILVPVLGKRLIYRFGPTAYGWN